MSRHLKNYAISGDAIKAAECGKFSDMRIALYFLRGMQRMGRLGDSDDTSLDKIDHPIDRDVVVFRIIDARHKEVRGGDVIDCVTMDEMDAVQILAEGRPDGLALPMRKLIV